MFRFQDECFVVAYVPPEDAEWSRDGTCLCFQKGNYHCVRISNITVISVKDCSFNVIKIHIMSDIYTNHNILVFIVGIILENDNIT